MLPWISVFRVLRVAYMNVFRHVETLKYYIRKLLRICNRLFMYAQWYFIWSSFFSQSFLFATAVSIISVSTAVFMNVFVCVKSSHFNMHCPPFFAYFRFHHRQIPFRNLLNTRSHAPFPRIFPKGPFQEAPAHHTTLYSVWGLSIPSCHTSTFFHFMLLHLYILPTLLSHTRFSSLFSFFFDIYFPRIFLLHPVALYAHALTHPTTGNYYHHTSSSLSPASSSISAHSFHDLPTLVQL